MYLGLARIVEIKHLIGAGHFLAPLPGQEHLKIVVLRRILMFVEQGVNNVHKAIEFRLFEQKRPRVIFMYLLHQIRLNVAHVIVPIFSTVI